MYEIHTFDRIAYKVAESYARREPENFEKFLRVFIRGLPLGYTKEDVDSKLRELGYDLHAVRQICLLKESVVARNHDSGAAEGATGTETRRVQVSTGTFAVYFVTASSRARSIISNN